MTTARLYLLLLAVLVACVGAPGCTSTVQVPERVNVQVPVPCVKPEGKPIRPDLRTEADLFNMPRGLRTLAAWADYLKLAIYAHELEAVVEGCSRLRTP